MRLWTPGSPLTCPQDEPERADLHFWDYDDQEERAAAPAHLAGTSAVQFITTSNITIHTLDKLKAVYLTIFTCGHLEPEAARKFCEEFWGGRAVNCTTVERH